jgi:hypothetical protein
MAYENGAVHFPVSWSPAVAGHEVSWLGRQEPVYPNLPPETVVKMHWRKSRYTVTYADGSRWCCIKDLELFGYEEELQWVTRK